MDDHAPAGIPTACSLDGRQARERLDRWNALTQRAYLNRQDSGQGPVAVRISYSPGPGVESELRALVALEAACCSFLTFEVIAYTDEVALTVQPAPGAGAEAHEGLSVLVDFITAPVPAERQPR
jgi:hypothetical protein